MGNHPLLEFKYEDYDNIFKSTNKKLAFLVILIKSKLV